MAKLTVPQRDILMEAREKGYVRCAEHYPPFKFCIQEGWLLRSGKDSGKGYITASGRAVLKPSSPYTGS